MALRTPVERSRAGTRRPGVHRRFHLLPTHYLQEALEPERAPGLEPGQRSCDFWSAWIC